MSRGVNKVTIIGNLGRDPEIRYSPSGDPIANFSVATSESWKGKQSGEKKEATEWHRIVAFGAPAKFVVDHATKGSVLYVEGSLRTRKWQDKSGADRYVTEIRASEVQLLSGWKDDRSSGSGNAEQEPSAGGEFGGDIPF